MTLFRFHYATQGKGTVTAHVHERRHSPECLRSKTISATSTMFDPPTHPECACHVATIIAIHAGWFAQYVESNASCLASSLYGSWQLHFLRQPGQFPRSQIVTAWTAALILRVMAVGVDLRYLFIHPHGLPSVTTPPEPTVLHRQRGTFG